MKLVVDIETNAIENPSKIWCIVAKDIDTGQIYTWVEDDVRYSREMLSNAEEIIGHNFIAYDLVWINLLLGSSIIDRSKVTDTLILSQLLRYRREDGGHSLEAWGKRLGYEKGNFNEFSRYSEEMLRYCIRDVELTSKLYQYLMHPNRCGNDCFSSAIKAEHALAGICSDMHRDGFGFNRPAAQALLLSLEQEVEELNEALSGAFPPKIVKSKHKVPRDIEVPFNPGSPKQIIERLNEAGWAPVNKTKGHLDYEKNKKKTPEEEIKWQTYGWKVDEKNLSTLSETAPPAARLLVKHLMLTARVRKLKEWLGCYNPETGRIHGRFNAIGTWTHRMSHNSPNMGNVSAEKSIKYNSPELKTRAEELGGVMRGLWVPAEDAWLVGTDMDQAHLRILAHLIEDQDLIEALVNGDSDEGTDVHTLNMRKLGPICSDRNRSKTFIYSFLNGAGIRKISEIFGCDRGLAGVALDEFIASYPGLASLKRETIPTYARQGYFIGLDGRPVQCDSEHHMLAGILQNAEKVLMTYANIEWRKRLEDEGIPYRQVNFIHDEWQTEVLADYDIARRAGDIQVECIVSTGVRFGLRCPLAGKRKVGKNWKETH